jgi:hypothetical protein
VAYLDRVIPQVCAAGLDYLWMFSIRYSGLSSRNSQRNTRLLAERHQIITQPYAVASLRFQVCLVV